MDNFRIFLEKTLLAAQAVIVFEANPAGFKEPVAYINIPTITAR
jgi:hypothetical protein